MAYEFKIRKATVEDCPEIKRLIQELADFEKFSEGPKLTVEDLRRDGFESNPVKFSCLVAENKSSGSDGALCGYALFFPTYSTWEGSALRLEDVYISPAHRRTGLGRDLLAHLSKEAEVTGCCRIDFSVLSWNPAAGFYKRLGAQDITKLEQWAMWRFDKDAIHELASQVKN